MVHSNNPCTPTAPHTRYLREHFRKIQETHEGIANSQDPLIIVKRLKSWFHCFTTRKKPTLFLLNPWIFRNLLSGEVPEMDEVCPEMQKALHIVGLSWLTCLFNVAWVSGTVALDWQELWSLFFSKKKKKKGDWRENHTA